MSREALQESLSALLDDQAGELEVRRILAADADPELRSTWRRYQVARAALHGELREPRLDIAASVSAALAAEPPLRHSSPWWQGAGRVAVAASVTVAVLVGVRFYNQDALSVDQLTVQTAPLMQNLPQVQGPSMLVAYREAADPVRESAGAPAAGTDWHAQRMADYLRQHARQATFSKPEGVLPFARAASLEGH
jgi:sigma-E factor negative regulatory protein RseA